MAKTVDLRDTIMVPHPGAESSDVAPIERFEVLPLEAIRPYENNPRRASNPKYAEIKESIRAHGLLGSLEVTQRPGEDHYIIRAGGNTRLQALNDLYNETRDQRYYHIRCMVHPYEGEAALLGLHLNENNSQGEITFWDNAVGYMELRARIEEELGEKLSLREFEQALHERGVICKKSRLSLYAFATSNLVGLGPAAYGLSGTQITVIQPVFNSLGRLVRSYVASNGSELAPDWAFEPLASFASALPVNSETQTDGLLNALKGHIAQQTGIPTARLDSLMERQKAEPDLTWETLTQEEASPASHPLPSPVRSTEPVPTPLSAPGRQASPPSLPSPRAVIASPRADVDTLAHVQAAAQAFAVAAHLTDYFRPWDGAFGWWLEPWDIARDDPRQQPLKEPKYAFWWFGAMLSCQWVPETWRSLPPDAKWRQLMQANEQGDPQAQQYLSALKQTQPNFCTLYPERILISYLKIASHRADMPNAPDPAGALFELIGAVHQLLRAEPNRVAPFVSDRAQFHSEEV